MLSNRLLGEPPVLTGRFTAAARDLDPFASGGGLEGPYGHILDFSQDANAYVTKK